MFSLQFLDIGLGLIFLYLVFSLACTAATEMIAAAMRLRARTLEQGIANLFRDSGLKEKILGHPLVRDLYRAGKNPSYIPAHTFSLSLLNVLSGGDGLPGIKELRAEVKKLPESSSLRKSLLVLMDEAGNDLKALQARIESWYNDTMDRVAGWYKTKAQVVTVVVAFIIAVGANADSIQWIKSLSNDPGLREALVAGAEIYAKESNLPTVIFRSDSVKGGTSGRGDSVRVIPSTIDTVVAAAKRIQQNLEEVKKLGISLGWQEFPVGRDWITKIVGLLMTVLALALGAPFWFDTLKRVANIKSSGLLSPPAAEEKKTQ